MANFDINVYKKIYLDYCHKHIKIIVWIMRLLVGTTFIFSGYAKAVDVWGFIFKIDDYLDVWHINIVSEEAIKVFASVLIVSEFSVGVLLALGCLRRTTASLSAALMAIMLPLSAYIYFANPVDDCGCFGEAFVISNGATFAKNIVLTVMTIGLVCWNTKVKGLYPHLLQWVIALAAIAYSIVIIAIGYFLQPIVDFRPYPIGTSLLSTEIADAKLIYQKNGVEQTFDVDALPDSSWTYVSRAKVEDIDNKHLAIFDGDEDVTPYVIEDKGPQVILAISNPKTHRRARASMANKINRYVEKKMHGSMIGVVATHPDSLEVWKKYSNPDFDVYTAEDTSIKELVRGDAAIIYLEDGIIKWKRNIYWLPADFPDFSTDENEFDKVTIVDDGSWAIRLNLGFIALLLILLLGSLPVTLHHKK